MPDSPDIWGIHLGSAETEDPVSGGFIAIWRHLKIGLL